MPSVRVRNSPVATSTRPPATTRLAPKRAPSRGVWGATSMMTMANGSWLSPACSVL